MGVGCCELANQNVPGEYFFLRFPEDQFVWKQSVGDAKKGLQTLSITKACRSNLLILLVSRANKGSGKRCAQAHALKIESQRKTVRMASITPSQTGQRRDDDITIAAQASHMHRWPQGEAATVT